MSYFYFLR